jgi:methyl-accepting chemotaxis protein
VSIKLRLLCGFLLVLCLTMGVAAVGWLGLSGYARRVDVAAAGQNVAVQIDALALAAERAVASADPDALALRDPLNRVRSGIDTLRLAMHDDGRAIDKVQGSIDAFTRNLAEYAVQERERDTLVKSRFALIGQFEAVATEIAAAQGEALRAAAETEKTGRTDLTAASASLQVLPFLMDAVSSVRDAETRLVFADGADNQQGLADALDWLQITTKSTAKRPGAEQAGPEIQAAITAWRDVLAKDPDAARAALPKLVEAITNSVKTVQTGFTSRLVTISAQYDDLVTQLGAATAFRESALQVEALALRARVAEQALVFRHDPASAKTITTVADQIEASAKDLLYRVTKPETGNKLKALIGQIGNYKQGLKRLTDAQDKQAALLREVNAATATAIAEAKSLTDVQLTAMRDEHRRADLLLGLGVGLALVLGLALAFVIGRGITKPLQTLAGVMERLAGGDKSVDIPGRDRRDELRQVAAAVAVFRDNAIAMDRMAAEQMETETRAEAGKRQAVLDLANSLDSSVSSVVDSIGTAAHGLQATASSLTATADEARRQATAASGASDMALANVQAVAAAAEELSVSIAEISRRTATSVAVAARAVEDSNRTSSRMTELSQAAERIETVVALIREIAGRTNLLALNATIEAARAGTAGAGFAVVASEVKQLAAQTAKATGEIAVQIGAMQQATRESADAIGDIARVINEMGAITTTISDAVEQQGQAATAIARNIQQAASGTADASVSIGSVSAAAEQTGDAADAVLSAAAALARDSDSLRGQVHQFLQKVVNG